MYIYNKIQNQKLLGKNISQSAREEGLDWKTVQKYFKGDHPPFSQKRDYKTRIDPLKNFYPKIELLRQIPGLSIWDIFNDLSIEGYTGSYHTVRRYLKSVTVSKKERFFEQEYEPGG